MPAHDRVRRNDRCYTVQGTTPDELALRRKTSALVVVQPQTPSTELLLQHPVFLDEVLDDLLLAAAHPACDGDEKKLEGLDRGVHAAIVGGHNSGPSTPLRRG